MSSPQFSRAAASLSRGNSQWKDETPIAFETSTAPAASARLTPGRGAPGRTSSRGPADGVKGMAETSLG